jgi:hypothetical protein
MPGESPSFDPEINLLATVSTATGPESFEHLVPEILGRAERGVTWRGTQGTTGAELEARKAILAAGPTDKRYISDWLAFRDPRLLRVLLLGNAISLAHGLGSYSLAGADPAASLEEWLFGQWRAARPWPGSPKWGGQ